MYFDHVGQSKTSAALETANHKLQAALNKVLQTRSHRLRPKAVAELDLAVREEAARLWHEKRAWALEVAEEHLSSIRDAAPDKGALRSAIRGLCAELADVSDTAFLKFSANNAELICSNSAFRWRRLRNSAK